MTACVNKKSKRVAAVVTASLVGALSIGAPAVALATGSDISMQSVGALGGGTLTAAEDGMRGTVTDLKGTVTLKAQSGQFLIPTEITDAAGNKLDVTDSDNYSLTYYREATGAKIGDLAAMESWIASGENAKNYTKDGAEFKVVVTNLQDTSDTKEIKFDYAADAQKVEYVAYDVKDGEINFDDTTFVYTGSEVTPHFCSKKGDSSSEVKNGLGGWTIAYTDAAGNTVNTLKDAGSYTAKLSKGTEVHYVKFSIEKLDLSTAALSIKDSKTPQSNTNDLLSNLLGAASADARVTSVKDPKGGNDLAAGQGLYEVSIAAKKDSENVTGSTTVKFWVLGVDLKNDNSASVNYGSDADGSVAISLADGESFDASKIKVVDGDVTYKGGKLEVSYTDTKTGKTVEASSLANPGSYKATVRVVPFQDDDDNWVGGSFELNITVSEASMAADKALAFTYDGKVVSGTLKVQYSGEDVLKGIGIQVKDADDNVLELGKDYKVVVTDADGDEVDSIVDAADGAYKVTVEGITFKFSDSDKNVLNVKVDQKVLSDGSKLTLKDYVNADDNPNPGKDGYDASKDASLFYSGSELTVPAVMVDTDKTDKASFSELDSKLYTVTKVQFSETEAGSYKTVKSIKDKGFYKVTVKLTDEAAKNYKLTDDVFTVQVLEKKSFSDVKATEWFAEPVFTAKSLGYVNGISETNLFAPGAEITRADAVCILFNMAGGEFSGNGEFSYNENFGWITGFSDVDGKAYFAEALAWANAADVANGSNGQFRPYDKITREEFASLLANFAKSKGDYEAVDADEVLGSATDYSAWAKQNVAWAKANKIMGNGGFINGTGNITRAEVAAMAVNYQPEKL